MTNDSQPPQSAPDTHSLLKEGVMEGERPFKSEITSSPEQVVSKIREAMEQAEALAINENSDVACQQIVELMPVALALLPQLEAMRANQSPMDIGEHNPNSEWMPPTLDTIARWKQHQVISRRDWVNVLTLLDKHMAMLARNNTALEMFWRMARTGASYKNCIRAYNDAGLGMLLAKEPVKPILGTRIPGQPECLYCPDCAAQIEIPSLKPVSLEKCIQAGREFLPSRSPLVYDESDPTNSKWAQSIMTEIVKAVLDEAGVPYAE